MSDTAPAGPLHRSSSRVAWTAVSLAILVLSLASSQIQPFLKPQLDLGHAINALCSWTTNENVSFAQSAQTTSSMSAEGVHKDADDDLERLRTMVNHTKGFFTRDFQLVYLGWNNIRYVIEGALMKAQLLNRTLIIPTFIYQRACEFDLAVCSAYGQHVVMTVQSGSTITEQHIWRIPIAAAMLNITRLRQKHSIITVSEYLRLRNISEASESFYGEWPRDNYNGLDDLGSVPQQQHSLFVVESGLFEPPETVRVDQLTVPKNIEAKRTENPARYRGEPEEERTWVSHLLHKSLNTRHRNILFFRENATFILQTAAENVGGWKKLSTLSSAGGEGELIESYYNENDELNAMPPDEEVERILNFHGWQTLYTYFGAQGLEYSKQMSIPSREIAPRWAFNGLIDDYENVTADVLLVAGEIHAYRKPGLLRFTTEERRDDFTDLVFHYSRPIDKVFELADRIADRLSQLNKNRMWLGAHMRRGDFITEGWVPQHSIEAHLSFTKRRLAMGVEILRSVFEGQPDMLARLPLDQDMIYIATDESDQGNLTYLRENGVALINDLLNSGDRQDFGWTLVFTDVLGLVEQALLARADFFYGDSISSMAGGVANTRKVLGWNSRTTLLDHEFESSSEFALEILLSSVH